MQKNKKNRRWKKMNENILKITYEVLDWTFIGLVLIAIIMNKWDIATIALVMSLWINMKENERRN